MGLGSWLYTNSNKNLRVKIVHPGGHAELHDRPVLASDIIRRNPRCCVAHPNVFKQPWAIVQPDTMLMLGQKVYVVPVSTVRKLQKMSIKRSGLSAHEDRDGQSFKEGAGEDEGESDTSCCSVEDTDGICMKPFNGRSEPKSKNCFTCMFSGSRRKAGLVKETGPSNNGKKVGSPGKLISSHDYWQPNLHSIVEERSNISVVEEERNIHQ
ncbi:hypothetical protein L1987_07365 [Smallanthus sonchifolius]|uniref:Uncharacterized protein n=1 Tax=Smallanthus sonchifolius TaxID=185202 RepID=A0ACB9K0K0_9ASTR|nr:hypothetical protein L1987_07365 [Smallanthus sonchifolius]